MENDLEHSFEEIVEFLEEQIGLSRKIVGTETIVSAVEREMTTCEIGDRGEYLSLLGSSEKARAQLIERVVVPETWFFRGRDSFRYLGRYAKSEWLSKHKDRVFRVLSIPCSTGEEPYSIAMALSDEGFSPESFRIDAVDISQKALEKAEAAIYSQASFRGEDLSFRDRYFERTSEGFKVAENIRNSVRFHRRNILSSSEFPQKGVYDAVFCRNLMIYMTPSARKRSVDLLERLSRKDGVVFFGHAESSSFSRPSFQKIRHPRVFACGKVSKSNAKASGRPPKPAKIDVPVRTISVEGRTIGRPEKSGARPSPLPGVAANDAVRPESPRKDDLREEVLEKARRLADQGNLGKAHELCSRFLEQKPLHASGHFLMGIVCRALRKDREAERCFQRTVYLEPGHASALEYLAFIEDSRNNASEASQLRLRARKARLATESNDW